MDVGCACFWHFPIQSMIALSDFDIRDFGMVSSTEEVTKYAAAAADEQRGNFWIIFPFYA